MGSRAAQAPAAVVVTAARCSNKAADTHPGGMRGVVLIPVVVVDTVTVALTPVHVVVLQVVVMTVGVGLWGRGVGAARQGGRGVDCQHSGAAAG